MVVEPCCRGDGCCNNCNAAEFLFLLAVVDLVDVADRLGEGTNASEVLAAVDNSNSDANADLGSIIFVLFAVDIGIVLCFFNVCTDLVLADVCVQKFLLQFSVVVTGSCDC